MAAIARRTRARDTNTWPGFVDALAALLMVIVFVLMIFIVSQFYLTQILSGRDDTVARLEQQIAQLERDLGLEREKSAELRLEVAQASALHQASTAARDALKADFDRLARERDTLAARLAAALADRETLERRIVEIEAARADFDLRIARATTERDALLAKLDAVERDARLVKAERDDLNAELLDAREEIEADRATIALQLRDLEALRRDIAALDRVRADLERRVAELAAARAALETDLAASRDEAALTRADLDEARGLLASLVARLAAERGRGVALEAEKADRDASIAELTALLSDSRDRSAALAARLAAAERRTQLAQEEIDDRDIRLEELLSNYNLALDQLTEEQRLSANARRQVDLLNRQLEALRRQLASLQRALDASEAENEARQVRILDLGKRLNAALATKVHELARFRSEFFGRLREVLEHREDIRVVGDRFVFESEVLFGSGSAEIAAGGHGELGRLADALNDIRARIPEDIDWILQVEGHTDNVPIFTDRFPSNWELSAARALSVVRFLIDRGVPPQRLSAAGYGEFQPIDPTGGRSRRNRRIEMKLTQR